MGEKVTDKVIEKVTDKISHKVDEVVEKVVEKTTTTTDNINEKLSPFSYKAMQLWEQRDKQINYNRSHIYGDISYRDNFKGDRELVARAGILYYLDRK